MKKSNEIDVSQIDLEKMREKTAENPGLLPYAHTSGSAVIRPEDKGKLKGRAVSAMQSQAEMQMKQLYEQMELLAAQANSLKKRVNISERIYTAEIPFEPLIGHTYYLYRRNNGQDVLSMIAPNEWGRSKSFPQYVATIKLLADHTWEILDSTDEL
jgi:hypothetical protein